MFVQYIILNKKNIYLFIFRGVTEDILVGAFGIILKFSDKIEANSWGARSFAYLKHLLYIAWFG